MVGTLYVVDALNFLFRAFHALPPLSNSKGVPTGAVYGLCQMLLRIEREWQPTHLCVVYDAPGPTFRDDLFPAYKANRPPMPADLAAQIGLSHRAVQAFGLPVLSVPGVEADDTIATLARQAVAAGLRVVICSSDKDLMQLCSDRIQLLDTMKNKLLGPAEVREKFGVAPDQLGDLLALMGDSVDNVPETAADLISQYGSLDGVLAHVTEIKGKKGQTIASSLDAIAISRRLVRLREDVVLDREVQDLQRAEPDRVRLAELFAELEFTRLLAQTNGARAAAQAVKLESVPTLDSPRLVLVAGSESGHRPPATDSAAAPEITARPLPPEIVLDRAGLDRLCVALRSAQACGVAVLAEGEPAPRAALVGLAFALGSGARFYLPIGHRLLGAPAMLSAADTWATLGPLLVAPDIRKYMHDAKVLNVLLRVRGLALGGLAGDAMLAAYLLDAGRAPYELSDLSAADGAGEVTSRATWLGSGRGAPPAGEASIEEATCAAKPGQR